jgi:hypothetical protein
MTRPLAWMATLTLSVLLGCNNMQHPRNDPFLGAQVTPPPATGSAGEITPPKQYYEQGRGAAAKSGDFGQRGDNRGSVESEKSAEVGSAGSAGLNFRRPSGRYGRQISTGEGEVSATSRDAAGKSASPTWNKETDTSAPFAPGSTSGGSTSASSSGAKSLPLKATNPGDNPLRQTAPPASSPSSRYEGEREDSWDGYQGSSTQSSASGSRSASDGESNPRYQASAGGRSTDELSPAPRWNGAASDGSALEEEEAENRTYSATRTISFSRPQ